jgi:Homeodomain-like domain-containing protein
MDEAWLTDQLRAGRSIESLARETGRAASTVAYWAAKYGLVSTHAVRHAARGGLDREVLEALVAEGLAIRAIAARLGVSYATVRHWLGRYGIVTPRAAKLAATRAARAGGEREVEASCPTHGLTRHQRRLDGGVRCLACRSDAVVRRRRAVKAILIEEAGGACVACGYDATPAALHFHHLDPKTKAFALGRFGASRSLAEARGEAAKCVLLCATCHAEVEGGYKRLPC